MKALSGPSWSERLAACTSADEVVGMAQQRARMADDDGYPRLTTEERDAAVLRRRELIDAGHP